MLETSGNPTLGAAWRAVRDRFRRADIDTPAVDARMLAEAAFGRDAGHLSLDEGQPADPAGLARLEAFAERRLAGEPVARILGHKGFYGLDFLLNDATLVPRPETELLVELGLAALRPLASPQFLDLGTGTGCIAIAILANLPAARAVATDLSAEALDAAAENARRAGVLDRLAFRTGSWCEAVPAEPAFDLIVANPPYVESDIVPQLQPEVSRFDPLLALDGGEDGLAAFRAIAAGAAPRLGPNGTLIVEIGSEQGFEVGALLSTAGFSGVDIRKDLAGLDRAVVAHHM